MERPPVYTVLHVKSTHRSTRNHSNYFYDDQQEDSQELVNIVEDEEPIVVSFCTLHMQENVCCW